MRFTVEAKHGAARAGVLETSHGTLHTPCFMPVGTYGAVKAMHPETLSALGAEIVLSNAYHLALSPGSSVIKTCGGIQEFMGWRGPVLTDSGGYQVFSLRKSLKLSEAGVECRSPLDGGKHQITPESSVAFQAEIGVDIAMMLDHCPPAAGKRALIVEAMERTTRWGRRALAVARPASTALFGIVQGGIHRDLRRRHLAQMAAMDFDGLALGGFSVGEPNETMHALVSEMAPLMDPSRPRYLMGVGTPQDLVRAVRAGIDMFDCVMPTRHARNGQLFTTCGRLNVANARHRTNERPPDPSCRCATCQRFSMAYLSHLYRRKQMLYHQLATIHNLHHYFSLMRDLRQAIVAGTLNDQFGAVG